MSCKGCGGAAGAVVVLLVLWCNGGAAGAVVVPSPAPAAPTLLAPAQDILKNLSQGQQSHARQE